jgi:translation initiation factor 1
LQPKPPHERPMSALVYSTESGRMCPTCRHPQPQCTCKAQAAAALARNAGDGTVRVTRETKGRGGKAVTLIKGLALDAEALTALAKQLKAQCGTGGTVKDGIVEIQGDHVEKLLVALVGKGFKAKRAGG